MNSSDRDHRLRLLIDSTLRDLPLRRAPEELQLRVLAAIARRAKQRWWRNSFTHWPLPTRVGFCIASAVLAKVAVDASMWLAAAAGRPSWDLGSTAIAVGLRTFVTLHTAFVNTVPSLWIYGALATLATMYGATFSISAVAYRTLYATRRAATPTPSSP